VNDSRTVVCSVVKRKPERHFHPHGFVLSFSWVNKPGIELCLSRILRLHAQCINHGSE